MFVNISKEQYNKLPKELQTYFEIGGDAGSGEIRKNIHPT